jgi:hypothetical protein
MAEIWSIVHALPPDKAPGPDSFTGLFLQPAWPVIKDDIFQAFNSLWSLDFCSFFLTNQVYMVLLCKQQVAEEVKDYWPISLIHCFSKLFAK